MASSSQVGPSWTDVSAGGENKRKVMRKWVSSLEEAREKRQWGQILEVSQEYYRTARGIKATMEDETYSFTKTEKNQLSAVQKQLHEYASLLKRTPEQDRDTLVAMDSVMEDIRGLMLQSDTVDDKVGGVSLPGSNIRIMVHKIGIKDAELLFQPFIRVSARDASGKELEGFHDTLCSSKKEGSYITFNYEIDIKTKISDFSQGSAIFFELLHYKPSKRRFSIKCFSFMELDELKPGLAVLEIYKKPTDFSKQKLKLLTNKSLYLHVTLQFT